MDGREEYRWIRPDGREISFPDRGSILSRVLSGEIGSDDLVRVSLDGTWIRAGELRASVESVLESVAGPGQERGEIGSDRPPDASHRDRDYLRTDSDWTPKHAPWRRYFARMADFGVAGFALGVIVVGVFPGLLENEGNDLVVTMAALLVAFPVIDAVALSRWNTSPGKWLLSVRTVRPSGEPIPYGDALSRAYGVVIQGMWFGIPILAIIPLIRAYSRTTSDEPQPWERSSRTYTEVRPLGGKVLLLIAFLLLTTALIAVEAMGAPSN